MDRDEFLGIGADPRPACSGSGAADTAREIGGDPSPPETSGNIHPAVIEDIQIKAELARYRIRGFGIAAAANLGHVRRPDFHSRHAHAHSAGRLSRGVLDPDGAGHAIRGQAARARNPAHGHGNELRGALAERQDCTLAGRGWPVRRPRPATAGCSTSSALNRAL